MSPHHGHSNYTRKPTPRHSATQGESQGSEIRNSGRFTSVTEHEETGEIIDAQDTQPLAFFEDDAAGEHDTGRITYNSKQMRSVNEPNKKKARAQRRRLLGAGTAAYVKRNVTWIGNLFYNLGFYTEYFTLRFLRVMRDGLIFGGQIFLWLFGGIGAAIVAVARDVVYPFTSFKASREMVREQATQRRRRNEAPVPKVSSAKVVAGLVLNIFKFLLPVAAAVALIFTINNIFTKNYALEVQVNGNVIGYVADETVLEDAQNILRMKIQLAPNQSLAEWQFTPVLTIGTTETLSNKNEIADQILRNSTDDIVEANGIYIDGELVGVTTEGQELRALLDGMLETYKDPEHPEADVSFVRSVEVSKDGGLYFTDSLRNYTDLMDMLTSYASEAVTYVVNDTMTLGDIAHDGGITFEQLLWRNPEFEEKKDTFKPEIGTVLVLHRAQPYLQVQVAYLYSQQEPIPFGTTEITDDTLVAGTKRTRVDGKEGLQNVWYDFVYVDGELTQKLLVDNMTEMLVAPVDKVVAVGTLVLNGGAGGIGGYSGTYLWPVPDATYSSRGFLSGGRHRGLDINGPTGTPVYASNAGTVVFAGYNWSYGYYVEIEHADGIRTLYAHNSALYVQTGDIVGQMAHIAAMGSTGNSTGPHCHFEILINNVPVDPYGFVSAPWAMG